MDGSGTLMKVDDNYQHQDPAYCIAIINRGKQRIPTREELLADRRKVQ